MFEFSIAWKYLLPKRRQLSVSIISFISVIVISLVVWLILVFFSVTKGLEKGWIEKLISMTAPVRITPNENYFNSFYYQIDAFSQSSSFSPRSIGEKKIAATTNPYDPETDEELPIDFPRADLNERGELKDIVKLAYEAVATIPSLTAQEFELASANLKLNIIRFDEVNKEPTQAILSQAIYVASSNNELESKIPLTMKDQQSLASLKGKDLGFPLLIPKNYREAGILAGDRGTLSYYAPTTSAIQEQRIPVYVKGFYDPGIVPLGGKFLLTDDVVVKTIRSSQAQENHGMTNGIHVQFKDLSLADEVKQQLQKQFKERGIDTYWTIETFREFDYAKDLLHQLSSEKNIFSLISGVIIIVACSNIVSMLIILVNQKRLEIGILRSMGASSLSIAAIFGICGFVMGMVGTLFGFILAYLTLNNLDLILHIISKLQGYQAFNPLFYGDQLPSAINYETVAFVMIATSIISIIAGLIPAIKASRMLPSQILRSE